jgi:hypothetical protein
MLSPVDDIYFRSSIRPNGTMHHFRKPGDDRALSMLRSDALELLKAYEAPVVGLLMKVAANSCR